MKTTDLERLQEIQNKYIGWLDIQIETRKDQQLTMFTMTDYPYSKKLYIHKLSWLDDNEKEFNKIQKELDEYKNLNIIK